MKTLFVTAFLASSWCQAVPTLGISINAATIRKILIAKVARESLQIQMANILLIYRSPFEQAEKLAREFNGSNDMTVWEQKLLMFDLMAYFYDLEFSLTSSVGGPRKLPPDPNAKEIFEIYVLEFMRDGLIPLSPTLSPKLYTFGREFLRSAQMFSQEQQEFLFLRLLENKSRLWSDLVVEAMQRQPYDPRFVEKVSRRIHDHVRSRFQRLNPSSTGMCAGPVSTIP